VLISLPNEEHLLRPGMNVEARFEVARRDDPLTIPVTALRTERDVATTAGILGITEDALRAVLAGAGTPSEPRGERQSARESAAGLRGSFWVVADRNGTREPVPVVTGVTDLDRVEITAGLAEGDVVLVLPSSSLLETQERLQNFMRGRGGIPGITQQPQQSGEAQGAPRGGQQPARGQRPAAGARPAGPQRPAGGPP